MDLTRKSGPKSLYLLTVVLPFLAPGIQLLDGVEQLDF